MEPHFLSSIPLTLIIGALFTVGALAAIVLVQMKSFRNPYEKTQYLLTKSELNFMKSLERVLPNTAYIAPKVRVADVLHVKLPKKSKRYWRSFTKISSKHIDYVICSRSNYQILGAIELDDSSHNREERRKRDAFLNEAFEEAGLPLIRIPAKRKYDPQKLREKLLVFAEPEQSDRADAA